MCVWSLGISEPCLTSRCAPAPWGSFSRTLQGRKTRALETSLGSPSMSVG